MWGGMAQSNKGAAGKQEVIPHVHYVSSLSVDNLAVVTSNQSDSAVGYNIKQQSQRGRRISQWSRSSTLLN